MDPQDTTRARQQRKTALVLFALVQATAAVFFVADSAADLSSATVGLHTVVEAVIAIGLMLGSVFGIIELRRAHSELRSHEDALAVASGAMSDIIAAQFDAWRLSPAEREIGMLALKGFDIAEIAAMRGAAQGTVRAQMTSIYAKSGTSGRHQFAAYFVEDLLAGGIHPSPARPDQAAE